MTDRSPEWLAGYEAAREQAAELADGEVKEWEDDARRSAERGNHTGASYSRGAAKVSQEFAAVLRAMKPPAER